MKIDRYTIIFIVYDNKPKRPSVGVIHELPLLAWHTLIGGLEL
ncbi:MAG: hypothetical protein RIG63_19925 [Coleofasciculus chthonoplastes F3-SA18-01]